MWVFCVGGGVGVGDGSGGVAAVIGALFVVSVVGGVYSQDLIRHIYFALLPCFSAANSIQLYFHVTFPRSG